MDVLPDFRLSISSTEQGSLVEREEDLNDSRRVREPLAREARLNNLKWATGAFWQYFLKKYPPKAAFQHNPWSSRFGRDVKLLESIMAEGEGFEPP